MMRKKIDIYSLLSKHELEIISEIVLECLGKVDVYPEIWELRIEAKIDQLNKGDLKNA